MAGGDDWYGSWDGPPAPLPAFHFAWEQPITSGNTTGPDRPAVAQAKALSKSALFSFPAKRLESTQGLRALQEYLKEPRWDGVVLDGDLPPSSPPSSDTGAL